jgi:hypothetical protein
MFLPSLFYASYLGPNSGIYSVHLPVYVVANDIKSIFKYFCRDFGRYSDLRLQSSFNVFFFFGATAPIWAFAYLHETLRFTLVFLILDSR